MEEGRERESSQTNKNECKRDNGSYTLCVRLAIAGTAYCSVTIALNTAMAANNENLKLILFHAL